VADIEFGGGVTTIATTTGLQKPGEVDVSAPIKIGGRAALPAPPPAAAIPGTIVDAYFDLQGRLVVRIDTPIPAGTSEIGGVNIVKLGGVAPAVDAGNTNVGTQRVVIATNDPNLSTLVSRTDIAMSVLRDALIGTGSKNFTTLEAVAEEILSQIGTPGDDPLATTVGSIDETLTTQLDIKQSELRDAIRGANTKDLSTLQTATDAIKIASETSATALGNLDTSLSSRASETTLSGVSATLTEVKNAVSVIQTTSGTLATETTLAAVNTTIGGRALESGGNLEATKNAAVSANSTLSTKLDIKQSELRDAICGTGTGTNNLSTLQASVDEIQTTTGEIQTVVDDIKTASQSSATSLGNFDALLSTRASESTLSAINTAVSELRDDLVDAINASRPTPVVTAGTGDEAISVSYAPGKSFWLDAVTVHLSSAPTTAGDLTVTLDAGGGSVYDIVLFQVDPSTGSGMTDIVYTPSVSILCTEDDAIVVEYANSDSKTYGTRIVTREI
jgi:hypothetical protein